MESLTMQDIELRNVDVSQPLMRSLSLSEEDQMNMNRIETKFGPLSVFQQGREPSENRPVLITYHDLGLNHVSNFQAFFNYPDMKLMLQSICVIHINAPGQEENAPTFPEGYEYPTLDQLADQIHDVIKFYNLKTFIGFGVGVGANILSRFALANSKFVSGLYLINPTSTASSWSEWLYQKVNVYYLSGSVSNTSFPQSVHNYLMWYHFGKVNQDRNLDLIEMYRSYFSSKSVNPRNLALFIESYLKRTDLGLVRNDSVNNFQCPVLLICGAFSPHIEDSILMTSRIPAEKQSWMKLQDCGFVLEEQPGKVAESLKLHIQGIGYPLSIYERRRSSLRKMSLTSSIASSVSSSGPGLAPLEESINALKISEEGDQTLTDDISADKVTIVPVVDDVHIVENPIQC